MPEIDGEIVEVAESRIRTIGEAYEIVGAWPGSTTSRTKVVFEPALFVAVTVYVSALVEVGVPEITPDEISKLNPADRDGEIDQLAMVPPVLTGVRVGIAAFTATDSVLGV